MNVSNPLESIIDGGQALQELSWPIENSSGEFSLYFAHCNYTCLREQLIQDLKKYCSVEIRVFQLAESATTLYAAIQEELKGKIPQALMVLGLESVRDPQQVFSSANRVREEFRKHFPFPLILWVNDRVLEQIKRWAPDFSNLATTTQFVATPQALLYGIQQETDDLFASILNPHTQRSIKNVEVHRWEAHTVLQELHSQGVDLEPALKASMNFVLGREADAEAERNFELRQEINAKRYMETACQYYQQSLSYWKSINHLERQGILLLHLGRNYACHADYNTSKGEVEEPSTDDYWKQARQYFQACLAALEQIPRLDLVAEFIGELGEVLQHQEDWTALQEVVKKALDLHQQYEYSSKLAQDYCFLANIALHQSRWLDANQKALQALNIISTKTPDQRLQQQIALLLLAQSQQHLERTAEAIDSLENARKIGEQLRKVGLAKPQIELRILAALHDLYFQQRLYLETFRVKHERYSIEQQYGLRAFIGPGRLHSQRYAYPIDNTGQVASIAQEIVASGRQRDIDELIRRIKEPQYKLTILHGPSGVGKSSMLEAGFIPALKQETILGSSMVPISLRNYTHWMEELGRYLTESLRERNLSPAFELNAVEPILAQLKRNEQQHLFTVLIFDQFEEFFFTPQNSAEYQQFTDFFCQCLYIANVKIILSLREDQFHLLLRYSRSIKSKTTQTHVLENILSQDNLYYIGNLSPRDAQSLIYALTQRSQVYQPDLVEALVRDLAGDHEEVRPIELQVVGSQLEEEHIVTLEQYQNRGPKEKFVQRYLDSVIADCGEENHSIAELALYLLTDENNTRPIKTKVQLETDLNAIAPGSAQETIQLDLVLQIFVESGLVVLLQEIPANRYQLVHDYLVTIIRSETTARFSQLQQQLKDEEVKRQQAEKERNQALEDLKQHNDELESLNTVLVKQKTGLEKAKYRLMASVMGLILLSGLAGLFAFHAKRSGIKVTAERSNALLASGNSLDALVTGLSAFKSEQPLIPFESLLQLLRSNRSQAEDAQTFKQALQEAAYATTEINRLEDHQSSVRSVSFSADGKQLVSAGDDNLAILWNSDGTKIASLNGHQGPIYSASFSPDGQIIATASADRTVKLWCRNCGWQCPYTLKEHQGPVRSVSFSPDNQFMATASEDATAILWKRDGEYIRYLRTLTGHQGPVYSVSFSSDSQTIATASSDQTVKLWHLDGTLAQTLMGHQGPVNSVRFSPDGQTLATASDDATVMLWNRDGTRQQTLIGHEGPIYSASFSPDGHTLATAGADHTVKLWSTIDGQQFQFLTGHQEAIYQVSFSPDGTLATASADTTVRLWQTNPHLILGHSDRITAIGFSPDHQQIATVSANRAKLWRQDNQSIRYIGTLEKQQGAFEKIGFSPDRKLMAAITPDHTIKLFDFNGSVVKVLAGHQAPVSSVNFSSDGQLIATTSVDNTIKLWDLSDRPPITLTEQPVRSLSFSLDRNNPIITTIGPDNTIKQWNWRQLWEANGTIPATAITGQDMQAQIGSEITMNKVSPDGHTLAIAARGDHWIQLWNIQNDKITELKRLRSETGIEEVKDIKFSPNGQTLAVTVRGDNRVRLWDLQSEETTEPITLQPKSMAKEIKDIKFSPNGQLIATVSKDKIVRLWNLQGAEQARFTWHYDDFVETLEFSPDGRLIALASTSGRIILWDWQQDSSHLEQFSCNRVQNYLKHKLSLLEDNQTLCN